MITSTHRAGSLQVSYISLRVYPLFVDRAYSLVPYCYFIEYQLTCLISFSRALYSIEEYEYMDMQFIQPSVVHSVVVD